MAGGLPLFDELGNRSMDGMMTCATCHSSHAEKSGTDETAVGETERFQRVPGSQDRLCIKCHPKQGNIIGSVHDVSGAVADSKNILGQTTSEKGVCSACHVPHYAGNEPALWAAECGEDEDLPSRYCLGCHDPEGSAKNKIPEHLSHPKAKVATNETAPVKSNGNQSVGNVLKDILIGPASPTQRRMRVYISKTMKLVDRESISKKIPPLLPLYDEEGKPGNSGILSCPSCHDIHNGEAQIREALFKDDSEREKLEKSLLRTSFVDEASRLCGECHGAYRVKAFWGFHSEAWGKIKRSHIYRKKTSENR
jgi:hypothetical protein